MAKILIISSGGSLGRRLSLVAAALEARGHEVIVRSADELPKQEQLTFIYDECAPIPRHADHDCKPDFGWRRERDYPTLREGMRRKQIKSLRK